MKKYAFILGGELRNKGAQDMTFRTAAALRERVSDLVPVVLSSADVVTVANRLRGINPTVPNDSLSFDVTWNGMDLLKGLPSADRSISRVAKQKAKRVLYFVPQLRFEQLLDQAAICVDISGFALSSQRGFDRCMRYLDRLEILHDRGIPTYLLPQSFGPFSFEDEGRERQFRARAREVLRYPRLICARERQGRVDIHDVCPDAHCVLAEDIVLNGLEVNPVDLFVNPTVIPRHSGIEKAHSVGAVPNAKTFASGRETEVLALWGIVVEELLDLGYNVYVIRHADDDLEWCLRLKELFRDDSRVSTRLENRLCFQYGELFAACDFLVASRFHSVVHAYQVGTPCVVLGWAEKYRELLAKFGQGGYCHDVRAVDESVARGVIDALRAMSSNHGQESLVIQERLLEIQSEPSAFDLVVVDFAELS